MHSDGSLPAREVVAAAAAAGVQLLGLSDHDTVDGVAEASVAAEGLGIRLAPAVEISAIDEDGRDLHVLGYRIDYRDARLGELLGRFRDERRERARAMSSALRELGFELDASILEQRAASGQSIGRPHLAEAVVGHAANARRLRTEDCAEPSAFLAAYLIEGKPAFRPRRGPSVAQAIAAIHDAGGVAIWAHPFWDIADAEQVLASIDRFRGNALDGVECFYPSHSRAQAELLADRCAELGLLSTGSSDFHGPGHRVFSRFRAFSTYGREPQLGAIAG